MNLIYQALIQSTRDHWQTQDDLRIQDLEAAWGRYKYLILQQDPAIYQSIRHLLKDKTRVPADELLQLFEAALQVSTQPGRAINASDHVWSHLRRRSSDDQRAEYQRLRHQYLSGEANLTALKTYLHQLAQEQEEAYLLSSYYFADVEHS